MPGNQAIGRDVVLIGQKVVADELGVTSQAISNWYSRAGKSPPGSHLRNMPAPTLVRFRPGDTPQRTWKQSQLPAWRKWHARHLLEHGSHIPARNRKAG